MIENIYPVLEHPIDGFEPGSVSGRALARVVEAHPALAPLLDFHSVDPLQIALEIGMVSPHEEDGADDLEDIDFGPPDWFEPPVGLAVIGRALNALRADPQGLERAIYDPGLRAADVVADLEAFEQTLLLARQHETRFHFSCTTD
jgi:hypothetical protein